MQAPTTIGNPVVCGFLSFIQNMTGRKVYLACPYSHHDPLIQEQRFAMATRVAAVLLSQGIFVFSPLTHGHAIAQTGIVPADWNFWQNHCQEFVSWCDALLVLDIPGLAESIGVEKKISLAVLSGKELYYVKPETVLLSLDSTFKPACFTFQGGLP